MGCGGSKSETPTTTPTSNNHKAVEMKFELSEQVLEQFLILQREIMLYENRHIPETLQVRRDQMSQLKRNLKKMEDEFSKLVRELTLDKGNHNYRGDRSVRGFLMGQEKYDDLAAYEKADHLAALNRQEILRKEIDGTKHHVLELQQEIDILEEDMADLNELYANDDKLLEIIFDGKYGSIKENKLEDELDLLELQLQKVEEANFKWRQAQVMVEYACKQIGTAVEKWEDIMRASSKAMESRYKLAEETRNNLIAAGQNLQGAQRYLPHIHFPYCTPDEVTMLNKATSYVFTDMQAKARQAHALDCYVAAHKRAAALLQWFNETINVAIKKDLMHVKEKTKKTAKELRRERVELIKQRVKEVYHKNIEVGSADIDMDNESELDVNINGHNDKHRNMSGHSAAVPNNIVAPWRKDRGSYSDLNYSSVPNAPSPLPKDELARLPTREELFGKMEDIKHEHERHMAKLNHDMKNNKNKGENGVHGKVTERRVRRARMPGASPKHTGNGTSHNNHNNHKSNNVRLPHEVDHLEEMDGEVVVDKILKRVDRVK